MKSLYLSTLFCFILHSLGAQNRFEINLNDCDNDQLKVKFTLKEKPNQDNVRFSFPAVVPGTYATEDYGRFVTSFSALDESGKKLNVKKEGNNTYVISSAKNLSHIDYTVEDIMDRKVKKNPIFQPASSYFQKGENFFINNGAVFGFIEGEENKPLEITIQKPTQLYGATSLPMESYAPDQQKFKARNYHQLIDCPMMFSKPDTAQFYVNKTLVTISVFDVKGTPRAKNFYQALKRDMEAIAGFLPALPVDHYTFLIFVDELHELGDALKGNMGFFKKIKLALKFRSLGIGALEHGNSSSYYLADFGTDMNIKEISLDGQLTGAAIHEFMHIVTPLGLHSQYIGEFNYTKPVMSKHLWLYEGITEYFAHLIKYKGGVYTKRQFLDVMESKLSSGEKFPVKEMSFTEMSANVLNEKYHKHYGQVYERGAALGFLLDAEIQRLTGGKKSLIDVVLKLNSKYGAERSFNEDTFIDEFVAEVHPDLKNFFSLYIEGKNQWKPNDQLSGMNLVFHDSLSEKSLLIPVVPSDNDVKVANSSTGLSTTVTKVGPNEWAGLKPGDVVDLLYLRDAVKVNGEYVKEGSEYKIKIKRNKQEMLLPVIAKYGMKKRKNVIREKP